MGFEDANLQDNVCHYFENQYQVRQANMHPVYD